jgi:hypothetical protein
MRKVIPRNTRVATFDDLSRESVQSHETAKKLSDVLEEKLTTSVVMLAVKEVVKKEIEEGVEFANLKNRVLSLEKKVK